MLLSALYQYSMRCFLAIFRCRHWSIDLILQYARARLPHSAAFSRWQLPRPATSPTHSPIYIFNICYQSIFTTATSSTPTSLPTSISTNSFFHIKATHLRAICLPSRFRSRRAPHGEASRTCHPSSGSFSTIHYLSTPSGPSPTVCAI